MLLDVSIFWLVLVTWLTWRAFCQRNVLPRLAARPERSPAAAARVAVIVPARNEAANIGPCLRSLIDQDYPPDRLHLVAVDDESSDETAAIAGTIAATEPRLTLVSAPQLPPGWKGKVNACCAGVRAAPDEAEWLCFIDADMRADPALIRRAVAAARAGHIDLLSLTPRHDLVSFAERLIIPCGHYLLAFTQDLGRAQSRDSNDVVASGQCMLLRRTAYEEVGGLASVCTAICEDLELARLLKRRGHYVQLQDGSDVLATRMYTGWRTLWPGIAKNLVDLLGGPARTVITAGIAVTLAWAALLLPAFDLMACANGADNACIAVGPALLGSAAVVGLHVAGAAHFRIPAWYGLIFPVGYTAGAIIALDSLRWRLTGSVRWKGRVYP